LIRESDFLLIFVPTQSLINKFIRIITNERWRKQGRQVSSSQPQRQS